MTNSVELGLDTFGDVTVDEDGNTLDHAQVIRNVVEQAVLADQLGVDFIGLGEHHRSDFSISSPEIVLSAIAARTERIHLGTAVTVLSSDDPVRVHERFSTLDAVSNGRAEIIVGRGSFTESFPLFGYPLSDYEVLFEEKLDLLVQLIRNQPVTWQGTIRSGLSNQRIYPTMDHELPVWVGVGGNPESVVRAAHHGLRLMLAIIGGQPARFAPLVDLYLQALEHYGRDPLPVGVHSPGHVAETDEQALEELWPHYELTHTKIGAERGWGPVTRAQFEATAGPDGALFVGSPDTVAAKIARVVRELGLSRFDMKYSSGPMPHRQLMSSIGLYGSEVIPKVRALLAG